MTESYPRLAAAHGGQCFPGAPSPTPQCPLATREEGRQARGSHSHARGRSRARGAAAGRRDSPSRSPMAGTAASALSLYKSGGAPRSPGDAAQHHGTGHGAATGQEPSPHGARRGRGGRGRLLQEPPLEAALWGEAEGARRGGGRARC